MYRLHSEQVRTGLGRGQARIIPKWVGVEARAGAPKQTSLNRSGGSSRCLHVGTGLGVQENKFEQVCVWSYVSSPWTGRQTDTTENISLPHSVAGGNKHWVQLATSLFKKTNRLSGAGFFAWKIIDSNVKRVGYNQQFFWHLFKLWTHLASAAVVKIDLCSLFTCPRSVHVDFV